MMCFAPETRREKVRPASVIHVTDVERGNELEVGQSTCKFLAGCIEDLERSDQGQSMVIRFTTDTVGMKHHLADAFHLGGTPDHDDG